ncbi:MAG: Mur ligase family protein [Patescibacteria group bacterium]
MKVMKSTIIAILFAEVRLILHKYKPEIISITGSVGKTSAKEAVYEVVKASGSCRRSDKNYNSEIGVSLAVIGMANPWYSPLGWLLVFLRGLSLIIFKHDFPKTLVLEVAADRPGDIKKLADLINPHIAVVTAIGEVPVHVEFFSGPEEVAYEKSKILSNLQGADFAILNFDDLAVLKMRREIRGHVLTFGFGEGANIRATDYKLVFGENNGAQRPVGITFKLCHDGRVVPFRIFDTFGKTQVYAALAATTVGIVKGMNLVDISQSLTRYRSPVGRLSLIDGIRQSLILDDSYNASPAAMHAALDLMRELPAKRKVAVLGDMLELGEYTELAHRAVAGRLGGVDILITVGSRAKFIADEARKNAFARENIFEFYESEEAAAEIKKKVIPGDLILVKGSESMRMEKIVEAVMAHPEKAGELLVRQEREWKNK